MEHIVNTLFSVAGVGFAAVALGAIIAVVWSNARRHNETTDDLNRLFDGKLD